MLHPLFIMLLVFRMATLSLANDDGNLHRLRDLIPKGKHLPLNWFDPSVSPCNWSGITCSAESVVEINLSNVPLNMSIPSMIGEFKNLKRLTLRQCRMFGPIPETLGDLLNLEHLDLSSNSFEGSLFPKIGSLEKLVTLNVEFNGFTGALTNDVGKLSSLSFLHMRYNDFTGSLPLVMNNMKILKFFTVRACKLNGSIPEGIFLGLQHLETLDLSKNFFSGLLPDSFAGLIGIKVFDIRENHLEGSLPNWMSNWQSVVTIDIGENDFSGSLPQLNIKSLISFAADSNQLSGLVASKFCYGNAITFINLSKNKFTGSIDQTFRSCTKLKNLLLSGNEFYGVVPHYLSNLPLLKLDLSHNKFTGLVPNQQWKSLSLTYLDLSNNKLVGQLPSMIGKMSSLEELHLNNNAFKGKIPKSIGKLQNLTNLSVNGNKLSGWIPQELFECINLGALNLGSNNLTGIIPKLISQLKLLAYLDLSNNQLSGPVPSEICAGFRRLTLPDSQFTQHYGVLDLSNNFLTGLIPAAIRNCTLVKELKLQGNKLSGCIPPEVFDLTNLTYIDLSLNSLIGPFTPQLFPSTKLQGIFLSNNQLNGSIPNDLGFKFPNLVEFNLSCNKLVGPFPKVIFNMTTLKTLDISKNFLSGPIPFPQGNVTRVSSLLSLRASDNKFSGTIAESLESGLPSLSVLDLHGNNISGKLPSSIARLDSLSTLDLSNNNMEGVIPCTICTMVSLSFLDLSGNKFNVYELRNCPTTNASNTNASNHCLSQYPSPIKSFPPSNPKAHLLGSGWIIIVVTMTSFIVCIFFGLYFGLIRCRRLRDNIQSLLSGNREAHQAEIELVSTSRLLPRLNIIAGSFTPNIPRLLNLDDISKATQDFNDSCIIGHGGGGIVYKAMLGSQLVAIKRLLRNDEYKEQAEFKAEMETLGKVKHRNLVQLLGYCVSGDEDHFLIYDYLENGSLDNWLWNRVASTTIETLGWPTRLKICLGSARGLEFLHHVCAPRIIHRDIKSSNILLDVDFEPKVSDFGLARILADDESRVDTILAGTIGYVPPEYSQMMGATTKGDVYSFGVVILELLTGKPPIGQEVAEGGGNLVYWVQWMAGKGKEAEVFDKRLPTGGLQRKQMVKMLAVANACTIVDPRRRPTMLEVVNMLNQIDAKPSTSRGR